MPTVDKPEATTPTGAAPTTPATASNSSTSVASIKLDLPVGAVVATPRERYTIIAHLANSGLTKLYLVLNSCRARRVMRVEYAKIPRVASRIKTELALLDTLGTVKTEHKSHFLQVFDKGRTKIFKFVIVMQMGPTLLQIREKLLEQDDFGEYTACWIACGTFQAVRDLHMLGFIHRDINLARFAVGLDHFEQQIFMYNLKEMKKFVPERKRSREVIPFRGSLLFASRNAMDGKAQSRKDDLESWLYMIFDVYDRQTFSSFFEGRQLSEAIQIKDQIMSGKFSKSFFKKIPQRFTTLCKYIDGLEWHADPDYEHIEQILIEVKPSNELRRSDYLDWTGKISIREDLKDLTEKVVSIPTTKAHSRADIVSNADFSSKSDGSSAEDEPAGAHPKAAGKRPGDTHRSKQSAQARKGNTGRRKISTNRRSTVQRKKQSVGDKSGKTLKRSDDYRPPPSAENVEAEGRSMGRAKGARRYKGSRNSSTAGPPSKERIDAEPASHTGQLPGAPPFNPSKESENGPAPSTPSKEPTAVVMTAAEKQKHAERLRRQMHINITETTEEDLKFTFLNDKKKLS